MGILIMDSMGWPHDSLDCLSHIQEFGTDCFCLIFIFGMNAVFFYFNEIFASGETNSKTKKYKLGGI